MPPELLNNDPEGFAWGVWHDRTPKLIRQIQRATPYGPAQTAALDRLLDEIRSGPMTPLPASAADHALWDEWGPEHFGRPWEDAPFLWSESYFFRRVLEAVDYFTPGPWRGVDPFAPLKRAELETPELAQELAFLDKALPVGKRGETKLLASLWGNQADLGFLMGSVRGDAVHELVCDDSEQIWKRLGREAHVVVVADNAGRELVADLALIDHLLAEGLAASVSLHLKPVPYYVSDATGSDFADCMNRLGSERLVQAVGDGRLVPVVHEFYCAPWSFHKMPADLRALLEDAALVLLKGDLNYRRLVGDLAWPETTPFAEAVEYFPAPVAALRTLKSDVVVGLPDELPSLLDTRAPGWRTNGQFGLIQASR